MSGGEVLYTIAQRGGLIYKKLLEAYDKRNRLAMDWKDGDGPGGNSSDSKKKFNRHPPRKGVPPTFDELLQAVQDYLKKQFPSGKGSGPIV